MIAPSYQSCRHSLLVLPTLSYFRMVHNADAAGVRPGLPTSTFPGSWPSSRRPTEGHRLTAGFPGVRCRVAVEWTRLARSTSRLYRSRWQHGHNVHYSARLLTNHFRCDDVHDAGDQRLPRRKNRVTLTGHTAVDLLGTRTGQSTGPLPTRRVTLCASVEETENTNNLDDDHVTRIVSVIRAWLAHICIGKGTLYRAVHCMTSMQISWRHIFNYFS